MVSDKYDRYDARKGRPHGSPAGLRGTLRRVYPAQWRRFEPFNRVTALPNARLASSGRS